MTLEDVAEDEAADEQSQDENEAADVTELEGNGASKEITCCPHCDSPKFHNRIGDGNYHCVSCGRKFEEPKVREREHDRLAVSGNTRKLLEANKDDYP